MLPSKKVDEMDVKVKVLKNEYYQSKIKTLEINNLQNYMNSSAFKYLCISEKEVYQKQMHKLLGLPVLSDSCSETADR